MTDSNSKPLTKEELQKRNAAIKAGREKDRQYSVYHYEAVRRMKAAKDSFMSHSAYIARINN